VTGEQDAAGPDQPAHDPLIDPRAIRASLAAPSIHADVAPIVIEPAAVPLAPSRDRPGTLDALDDTGTGPARPPLRLGTTKGDDIVVIDGEPVPVRLDRFGSMHGVIRDATDAAGPTRTPVVILPADASTQPVTPGATRREVIVEGWRIEVEVESERRASLRERSRRGRARTADGGTTEVRAIIPGVVASVSVVPGDAVAAGQQLLVVEAMKMQNELRAPRDAVVSRVAVGVRQTIEVGDLLLVLD
jgi:biotin carboxyl carrier protein